VSGGRSSPNSLSLPGKGNKGALPLVGRGLGEVYDYLVPLHRDYARRYYERLEKGVASGKLLEKTNFVQGGAYHERNDRQYRV
jgi:hypothetical protein